MKTICTFHELTVYGQIKSKLTEPLKVVVKYDDPKISVIMLLLFDKGTLPGWSLRQLSEVAVQH